MSGGLLFVGLDNPQSRDPRYALFPSPKGCTGHRLMEMMGEVDTTLTFTRKTYIDIPKLNLFPVGPCPTSQKRGWLEMAGSLLKRQLEGQAKNVVLFGNEVRDAVFTADTQPKAMEWIKFGSDSTMYAWVPHPSGRNRYYNDTRKRRRVARFMQEAGKVR